MSAQLNELARPVTARMPQQVADALRRRILSGELADGEHLPKEELLREHFGVGRPVMREAMRILEAEGLVRVMRGNRGGATVHAPQPAYAAYALALLLSSRGVRTRDLGRTLLLLEPSCARLCAERANRERALISKELEALHRAGAAALEAGDVEAATVRFREFHEKIVAACGNQTLMVLLGALETIWSENVKKSVRTAAPRRPPEQLRKSMDDHAAILDAIREGDGDGAARAVAAHLARVQAEQTRANEDVPIEPPMSS